MAPRNVYLLNCLKLICLACVSHSLHIRLDFTVFLIGFEKVRKDPITGKTKWKLVNENSEEHKHKTIRIHTLMPS